MLKLKKMLRPNAKNKIIVKLNYVFFFLNIFPESKRIEGNAASTVKVFLANLQ